MTHEGKQAVKEAIEYLQKRKQSAQKSEELIWSDEAAALCSENTDRGIEAPDSAGLIPQKAHERFKTLFSEEFGGEEKVGGHAECHEYGSADALEILLTLIIDDGNATRSNRQHLFGNWDYVGLSSKPNPTYKQMTSMLFVVAEDTIQQELSAAVQVSEELLCIKDMKWSKKKVGVALDPKGFILVTITLSFAEGPDKVLTHKMASKTGRI